ncbi:MAG: hypothetical protein WB992_11965, partial [Bryobacteraceae bacterium]
MVLALVLRGAAHGQTDAYPQAEISNGLLHAKIYLPDAGKGYYRGTRFDWSGVIGSLEYEGHDYYGPWFTRTDPKVRDFIYEGVDIVAGPCSAIMGPVEEFSTKDRALGYDSANAGGTFIKIGVGVLRRPDAEEYSPYRLYQIINPGKRIVRPAQDAVEFVQELTDPGSGYGYVYTKVIRLRNGKAEMVIEHKLKNTGRQSIETSVYDHNFLVLDKQPIGPDFIITLPFEFTANPLLNQELAAIRGNQLTFLKALTERDTVFGSFSGFSDRAPDYNIRIENRKVGAGMKITGDRPLSRENL